MLLLFSGSIIGLLIYGKSNRNYEVLQPTEMIKDQQVSSFVEKYKPFIYQNNSIVYSPIKLFYEVVSHPDYYVIIYRGLFEKMNYIQIVLFIFFFLNMSMLY